MKLLRAVIYIDKQQIVQQQVLKEIILVKMLLVRDHQILDLAHRYFSDHISIRACPLSDQYIEHITVLKDLQHMIPTHDLAVGRRSDKIPYQFLRHIPVVKCCCHRNSFHIDHTQINLRDGLELVYACLNYLV